MIRSRQITNPLDRHNLNYFEMTKKPNYQRSQGILYNLEKEEDRELEVKIELMEIYKCYHGSLMKDEEVINVIKMLKSNPDLAHEIIQGFRIQRLDRHSTKVIDNIDDYLKRRQSDGREG